MPREESRVKGAVDPELPEWGWFRERRRWEPDFRASGEESGKGSADA